MQRANPASGKALIRAGVTPVSPGAYLEKIMLPSMKMGVEDAARDMRIPVSQLRDIIGSRRRVTHEIAEALSRLTRLSVKFWLNMQAATDLSRAPKHTPASQDTSARTARHS
ncbi:HigA family addiction module antitoxin [Acidisphaera sp. S103]|uniref:HigA family addiction module antitoxin n=1 Tax=Acidisphaera sp. S103 TaxID=1747223 RepID=UPI00131C4F95